MIDSSKLDFNKLNGLIPAIINDVNTDKVLMLGFMNKEALEKTVETGFVTFFSRTKNRLWTKGETSGNFLKLVSIKADCDLDSLLISADPVGNTCHNGNYSCFGIEKHDSNAKGELDFLSDLFSLIKTRKKELPENSYTTKLFQRGTNRIIQKVGEEAIETVIAAKNRDKFEIVNEVSDLVYHLFVMLAEQDIEFSEIVSNLEKRHNK
ncbi:MAG: bifunctional phosphoribosyl-AMP cyclohydrolase/phosphoribosyl-ATP diphosphatase HisIE [Bacteroidota bacterium]|nr:bifunctional phosphoribosyl-AMP cyclohydrolase/phosphoribosyl-ATP diphosphatase HisIE [Bacteroidota bacterium]MDP4190421.1 bifunctional phosphoribosyl-AMP cyclohydrolase/phosphoribosyl-ATP diphosphatase HisIE [Bacteroidota bacterium]MDP4194560.1 bifunctional phosphoribosyl-AMP cyclohydrolase/phosphoribosyl-ATP diphosphatase HisIE [Bacteroidota bacterium]